MTHLLFSSAKESDHVSCSRRMDYWDVGGVGYFCYSSREGGSGVLRSVLRVEETSVMGIRKVHGCGEWVRPLDYSRSVGLTPGNQDRIRVLYPTSPGDSSVSTLLYLVVDENELIVFPLKRWPRSRRRSIKRLLTSGRWLSGVWCEKTEP